MKIKRKFTNYISYRATVVGQEGKRGIMFEVEGRTKHEAEKRARKMAANMGHPTRPNLETDLLRLGL
jgi:hypothetical protein